MAQSCGHASPHVVHQVASNLGPNSVAEACVCCHRRPGAALQSITEHPTLASGEREPPVSTALRWAEV
jgi:hypothetical protein